MPDPNHKETSLGNNVLLVQPDSDFINVLKAVLSTEGYEVTAAGDGDEALKQVFSRPPKLVVLDMVLPKLSGFEVCRKIRDWQRRPHPSLLALTAGADESEIAFTLGADDCVSKPVNLPELVVRVRRLLRARRVATGDSVTDEIAVEDLHLDIPRHQATVEGKLVHLTSTEFKLLQVLAQRRGRVQSRERLLEDVWEYNCTLTTRTVDTHVLRLRRKLGPARRFLQGVRGIGYRFAET